MLSSLVKDHQARHQVRKDQQEIKRKEALSAANNLTTALVDHLNVGVAQVRYKENQHFSFYKLETHFRPILTRRDWTLRLNSCT